MRNITQYTLLVGGYFANISVFTFDPSVASTGVSANSTGLKFDSAVPHPLNPTWFETKCGLFAAAESDANVVTRLSLVNDTLKVLEQVSVGGDPVHLTTTPDCTGLISSSYSNGTISYIPLLREVGVNRTTGMPVSGDGIGKGAGGASSALSEALAAGTAAGRSFGQAVTLRFNATYPNGTAPQDQSRAHSSLVHGGKIYTADLGSDRIWISKWTNGRLKLEGAIETPKGFGPRHMVVVQPDEKPAHAPPHGSVNASFPPIMSAHPHGPGPEASAVSAAAANSAAAASDAPAIVSRAAPTLVTPGTNATKPRSAILYVVGELANEVAAFELDKPQTPLFQTSVIPPGLNKTLMAAGEIMLNPRNSSQIFVSNRLAFKSNPTVKGDSIAILSLSDDRKRVTDTRFLDTDLNNIRGMKFSSTGEFLALAGLQRGFGIYTEKAGEWTQVARYDPIEQAADFAWIKGSSYRE